MSAETVGLLGTGAQDGHLDFHTAPELCPPIREVSHFYPTLWGQVLAIIKPTLHSQQNEQLAINLNLRCGRP